MEKGKIVRLRCKNSLGKKDSALRPSIASTETSNEKNMLDIRNIAFSCEGRPLFRGLSLQLKKGRITSLLGKNASGKTTLLNVLMKLNTPESGNVQMEGIDWSYFDEKGWQTRFGMVTQDSKIFNNSLLYNITLSYKIDDMIRAIEFCDKMGFVKYFQDFSDGYLTQLGSEGVKLSAGHKQLICLARALFRQPKILLLDEPTSAMDDNMEGFVMRLLQVEKARTTILLVTCRISLAQQSDFIFLLEKGKIAVSGHGTDMSIYEHFYRYTDYDFFS
ncbi:MAG: ATP-binding cassette domain-containing protein [Cyclobacteriaceae bacterium]|jgi:ATP-binding cassette subfamily B protein